MQDLRKYVNRSDHEVLQTEVPKNDIASDFKQGMCKFTSKGIIKTGWSPELDLPDNPAVTILT